MSTYYAFEKFAKEQIQDLYNTKAQIRLEILAEQVTLNETQSIPSQLAMLFSRVWKFAAAARNSADIPQELPQPQLDSKQVSVISQ